MNSPFYDKIGFKSGTVLVVKEFVWEIKLSIFTEIEPIGLFFT